MLLACVHKQRSKIKAAKDLLAAVEENETPGLYPIYKNADEECGDFELVGYEIL